MTECTDPNCKHRGLKILKREWVTTFVDQAINANLDYLSEKTKYFFCGSDDNDRHEVILPEGLEFDDLIAFVGKKVRITIEVI